MRYSEYRERVVQLEKELATWRRTKADAEAGKRPWLGRIYPALLHSTRDKADRRLTALCRKRNELEQEFFGGRGLTHNANLATALQREVPAEAIRAFHVMAEELQSI